MTGSNLKPPVVGLTAYGERAAYLAWDHRAVLLPDTYPEAVLRAGGIPVLLPPLEPVAAAVDRLDALVLSGGPDLDPRHYGAEPDPHTGLPRPERDAAELAILHRALAAGIPVLGVCRGIQVLNVALGGTLTQHLPDTIGHTGHNPTPGVFGTVQVRIEPDTLVHRALGTSTVDVKCHHHQGLDRLGEGLVVTAWAADGTVEAVELPGRFVVGVQWHPEQDPQPDDVGLFAALVSAAARDREQV